MKIINIIKKLEQRIESQDNEYLRYERCALALLDHLKGIDPNIIVQRDDYSHHTGDHYPIDEDFIVHFDKKRFFREDEDFPDDGYTWIPVPSQNDM